MNMLKRTMAMLMVLCMLVSAVPMMALAAETDSTESGVQVLAEGGNTEFIRAFALDCGRLYFSVDNIKEIIDVMAANDYTHLTLAFGNSGFRFLLDDMTIGSYSSDDVKAAIRSGNTFFAQNDGHNGSSAANTCLTQADMDTIIAYANGKGIQIIPALNSPGHMNTIVYAMTQLGISNAGYPVNSSYNSESTLNINNSTVIAFSDALIQKYVNYFAGKGCKYFNLGADEFANDPTDDVQLGFNNNMKSGFISYVNRVASMISAAGMTPMMFNDGYAWSDANFNKDIVVCYWTSSGASSTAIANAGHKIINNSQKFYYVMGEPFGSAANNWCSYASATNGVNNVSVTTLPDNGNVGDKLIGAQMFLWCDFTDEVYTAEEKDRVKTLITTLAENNPAYFNIPEPPADPVSRSIAVNINRANVDVIEGYAYTEAQIADPSKVSVNLNTTAGVAATVSSTAATQLEAGATYIIRDSGSGYVVSSKPKSNGFSGMAMENSNLVANEDYFWTLEASGNGYKLKAADGTYLSIARESASLGTSGDVFTITRSGNGWQIVDSDNYAFNALGGINYAVMGGWDKNENPLTLELYKVTVGTPASTEVEFTGLAEGTTTVTVGHVTYTVTVSDSAVTETRNIIMLVNQTKTDIIENAEYTQAQIANPSITSVELTVMEATEASVSTTASTELEDGATYIIREAASRGYALSTNPKTSGSFNGLALEENNLTANEAHFWTLEASGNGYKLRNAAGQYLTIGNTSASVNSTGEVFTISRVDNGWQFVDSSNLSFNALGGGNSTVMGGWTKTQSPITMQLYKVNPAADTSTEVEFTGLAVGATTVTVGHVCYNVIVADAQVSEIRDITLNVGDSVTDTILDKEFTTAQIADPSIVSVSVTAKNAVPETTVSSTAATALEDGATYIMRVYNTNQALSSDRGRRDWNTNTLAFQTNNLTAETKHLWTLEQVNGGYKIRNANGYLNLGTGDNAAYLNNTGEVFTLTYHSNGWSIGNSSGRYINALGGLDTYHTAGGWTGDGTRLSLYKVTTQQQSSTEVTFVGMHVGNTTVTVGDVLYNVTVLPENLNNVTLTYHPWISTYPVYPEGTGSSNCTIPQGQARGATITAAAEGVYSEQGAQIASLIPATGDWRWEEDAQTVYWKATVLPEGLHQEGTQNTDRAMDGTDFAYIRYWDGQWEYSADRETWTAVASSDEVCAYYLQKTDVTQEVETNVKDWAFTAANVAGQDRYKKALSFAVVYSGGTMNPGEERIYTDSTLIYYDNLADLGFIRFAITNNYNVKKITYTMGERDLEGKNEQNWTADETFIWQKRTVDGHEWYAETVCWDESYDTEPVVDGELLSDVIYAGESTQTIGGNATNYNGTWGANDTVLILIYVEPIVTEDSLNVVYYDEKFGETLYSYPITVPVNSDFTNGIGKVNTDAQGNTTLDINQTPPAFSGNAERIDVGGFGITNNISVVQRFQTDLTKVPNINGKYNSNLYTYTGSEISEDGKTLYLYYNFDESALPVYVADFGLPLSFSLLEITQAEVSSVTVTEQTRYGRLSYRSDPKNIGGIFIYQPTSILQGADMLTINITFADGSTSTSNIMVLPATSVYYEEGFIFNENSTGWENTSNKGQYMQYTEALGRKVNNYGYDDVYTDTPGASCESNATASQIGAKTTFTFTGNGIQIFANATKESGYVAVEVKDSTGKVVNVSMVDTVVKGGETDATEGQEGNLYGLPIVSLVDLQNMRPGTYTVKLTKIMNDKPVYIDGIRVFNTVTDTSVYAEDLEDNPEFYELRDYVLNAVQIDDETSKDYGTLAEMANQVYAGISTDTEAPVAMVTTGIGDVYGDGATAQDLLDNGPKNELYLYPRQTLSFKVTTARVMQIGLKAPSGSTSATITVDGTARPQRITSSVDMFYSLTTQPGTEQEHLISITNDGENILSVTLLKVCDDPEFAFGALTEQDVEKLLQASFRASGESPVLTGDVDGDWDVDAADLTLVARHVGGIELLSDEMLKNADVDGDGIVNARDLTIHARFTGGIILRWKDDADQTA